MWKSAAGLAMTAEQKVQLQAWIGAPSTPQKIALRSRICLLAHEGKANRQIALELHTSRPTVLLWRKEFAKAGPAGLEHEAPRGKSAQALKEHLVKKIVERTLQSTPSDATHKHPKVKQWLKRHRRFRLHFTPTSSSWLNLVERWFAEITRKPIRRGSFQSVKELVEAINSYIRHNNEHPKPFVWTKRVEEILEKVGHCKAAAVTAH